MLSFSQLNEAVAREVVLREKYVPLLAAYILKIFEHVSKAGAIEQAEDYFQFAVESDPTHNKVYLQWILNTYLRMTADRLMFIYQDIYQWKETLANFDRLKSRMPQNLRDINKYKYIVDIEIEIEPYTDVKSAREIKRDEVAAFKKDIEIVYQGPEGFIAIPKTEAASKYLGRGTQWCTAATAHNYFDHYNKQGPLYCLIHADGRKWQFHLESTQFMDEKDHPLVQQALMNDKLVARFWEIVVGKWPTNANNIYEYRDIVRRLLSEKILQYRVPAIEKWLMSSISVKKDFRMQNSIVGILRQYVVTAVGKTDIGIFDKFVLEYGTPFTLYDWAYNVKGGPWKAAEPKIATNGVASFEYAKDILRARFIAGEKTIYNEWWEQPKDMQSKTRVLIYQNMFNVKLTGQ